MIIASSDDGLLTIEGTPAQIGDEMMHIMEAFTTHIASTPEGKDLVTAMFNADTQIIINFVELFVRSKH